MDFIDLGHACLIAAPFACVYAAVAAIAGARRPESDRRLVDSSRRAMYALCLLLTTSVVVIEAAFLRSDFSLALVADHSSTTTPLGYRADRDVVEPGRLAAALGVGAVDRLERGALSDPQPPPRASSRGRPRCSPASPCSSSG